ncbi:MAG TPA: hypothetical protein VEB64_16665 [Azospirillaceae bacterium]|nr:hypothetical protein [Azospirillaceae bacterium]
MSEALSDARHIHRIARTASHTAPSALLDSDSGLAELTWSLQLLRTTRIRVSLFRFVAAEPVGRLPEWAFAPKGLVGHLPDGSLALMLIGEESEDDPLARDVMVSLRRALVALDSPAAAAPIEIAALHRPADLIGEPEEALLHLLALPTRTIAPQTVAPIALKAA